MEKVICLLLICLTTVWARPQQVQGQGQGQGQQLRPGFFCPEQNGFYPDPDYCDKYWDCFNGEGLEKDCTDGLVFPSISDPREERCVYPFETKCHGRQQLQPPKPSPGCPRLRGVFAHPNATVCNLFYTCEDGKPTEYECPAQTHFVEKKGTCVWISDSDRTGCTPQGQTLPDGFSCIGVTRQQANGLDKVHPTFPHAENCQTFYICLNGVEPRTSGCPETLVYNDRTGLCDSPANVPGCENWYEPLDYYDDPGNQQVVEQQQSQTQTKAKRT